MGQSARSLSKGHPCEKPKLHIQLAGLDHPDGQSFQIYQAGADQRLTGVEATLEKRTLEDSIIYSWESEKSKEYDIFLAVEANDKLISLPLFQNLPGTELHSDISKAQATVVVPIVPLALLPCYKESEAEKNKAIGACRNGYIYIFSQGKAWRELKMTSSENGYEFRDVDLNAFRTTDGFTKNIRPTSGQILEEIWLPATVTKPAKGGASDLLITFSEVQWSAAYLTYLEKNTSAANERLETTSVLASWQPQFTETTHTLLSLNHYQPLRAREILREFVLVDPASFARNLDGKYLTELTEAAKQERSRLEAGGKQSVELFKVHEDRTKLGLDSHARYIALEEYGKDNKLLKGSTDATIDKNLFTKDLNTKDILVKPRARKLVGLVLQDPLFHLRHAVQQINGQNAYLQLLLKTIESQPDSKQAILIQQLITPKKIADVDNPYHQSISKIDTFIGGAFMRTIRETERISVHSYIEKLKKNLLVLLNNNTTLLAIKDIASLDGADSAGVHLLTGQALNALMLENYKLDYLSHDKNSAIMEVVVAYVKSIFDPSKNHPLYHCLFINEQETTDTPSDTSTNNNDVAKLTSARIDAWSPNNDLPDPALIQCIELKMVVETLQETEPTELGVMLENGEVEVDLFPDARRLVHYFDSLISNLSASAMALVGKMAGQGQELSLKNLHTINDSLKGLINRTIGSEFKIVGFKVVSDQYNNNYIIMGSDVTTAENSHKNSSKTNFRTGKAPTSNTSRIQYYSFKSSFGDLVEPDTKKVLASTAKGRLGQPIDKTYSLVKLNVLPDTPENMLQARLITRIERMAQAGKNLRLPLVIPIFEIINISAEFSRLKKTISDKSLFRGGAGIMSSILDMSIALAKLNDFSSAQNNIISNFLAKDMKAYAKMAKVIDPNHNWMKTSMSRLSFAAVYAGFLTAGISGWDAYYAWKKHDNAAAISHGVVMAGTAMMTTSGLIGPSAVLLGLGPIAWLTAGIAVTIAGSIAVFKNTNSEMDLLLKHGPFGTQPHDQGQAYSWLQQNPNEAYAHLAGLLINLRIRVLSVNSLQGLALDDYNYIRAKKLDTCVSIEYNLPYGLEEGELILNCHVREVVKNCGQYMVWGQSGHEKICNLSGFKNSKDIQNKLIIEHSTGQLLFYQSSAGKRVRIPDPSLLPEQTYHLAVRSQLIFQPSISNTDHETAAYIWPRPSLEYIADNNPADYATPTFGPPVKPLPYWADEINHGTDDSLSQYVARRTIAPSHTYDLGSY